MIGTRYLAKLAGLAAVAVRRKSEATWLAQRSYGSELSPDAVLELIEASRKMAVTLREIATSAEGWPAVKAKACLELIEK